MNAGRGLKIDHLPRFGDIKDNRCRCKKGSIGRVLNEKPMVSVSRLAEQIKCDRRCQLSTRCCCCSCRLPKKLDEQIRNASCLLPKILDQKRKKILQAPLITIPIIRPPPIRKHYQPILRGAPHELV